MSNREFVLGRVRQRLGASAGNETRELSTKARIEGHKANLRPAMSRYEGAERTRWFIEKTSEKGTQIHRANSLTDVSALIEELADHEVCHGTPAVQNLGLSLDFLQWQAKGASSCCVSTCYCAIAETGTLVLLGNKDNPTAQIFLADRHIVILPERQIEDSMESVWIRLRKESILPRHLTMVSGPSSTGDIEMKMEQGVHGPRDLHIILLAGGLP